MKPPSHSLSLSPFRIGGVAQLLFFATLLTILSSAFDRAAAQQVLLASAETAGSIEPLALEANELAPDINPPLPVAEGAAGGAAQAVEQPAEIAPVPRRFHYLLRLTIRGVYDDNINVSHDNRISDFVTSIEPGIMLGIGDITERQENYLQFVYAPSIFIYADHDEANAVQHLVHLEGQYHFSRLTLNLKQDVQILDGANVDIATQSGPVTDQVNVDVGGRTRVDIFTTQLSAAYYLSGKVFVSSEIGLSIYDYRSLISSESASASLFLNYVYSPKVTVGVGGGVGRSYVDDPNPDQTFQQFNARFKYQLSDKVDLNASAGAEFREFEDNGRDVYVSPVFELSANWKPFDGTAISLQASRRTTSSAVLFGQDYTSTTFSGTVRQRFLRRFTLGLTGGYQNSEYFSTVSNVDTVRSDNYFYVQPSVDASVTRFWSVGAYYLRRENSSAVNSFSFYDNQVGLRSSVTF
ncbi:MAG: outer membrane beta-barrel protein [Chthoniobacterales bacterium]